MNMWYMWCYIYICVCLIFLWIIILMVDWKKYPDVTHTYGVITMYNASFVWSTKYSKEILDHVQSLQIINNLLYFLGRHSEDIKKLSKSWEWKISLKRAVSVLPHAHVLTHMRAHTYVCVCVLIHIFTQKKVWGNDSSLAYLPSEVLLEAAWGARYVIPAVSPAL